MTNATNTNTTTDNHAPESVRILVEAWNKAVTFDGDPRDMTPGALYHWACFLQAAAASMLYEHQTMVETGPDGRHVWKGR